MGFSGSSLGEDSQVPGIAIKSTSGQLASWNSGRGFFSPGWLVVGGTAVGGTALGGDAGRRTTITMMATISATATAIAPAAMRPRMRWRLRRALVREVRAMESP